MSVQTLLVEPTLDHADALLGPGDYGAKVPLRTRGACPGGHGGAFGGGYESAPCCPPPCGMELTGVSRLLVLAHHGTPDPLGVARALAVLGAHELALAPDRMDRPGFGWCWARIPHTDGAREWWLRPGPAVYCGDPTTVREVAAHGHVAHLVPALAELPLHAPVVDVYALAMVLEARGMVKRRIELGAEPVSAGIVPWSLRTGLQ